ncbi:MAG TPA: hypothetical protein VFA18_22730 [Gemmataceae bacterium]|nr:hypothetical protein [Gemmataceae bacterium]
MVVRPLLVIGVLVCVVAVGCSHSKPNAALRRLGTKINIANFIHHPEGYKGKIITLRLHVDDPVIGAGRTLREHVGHDVRFTTTGPKGEQLRLVITIPQDLAVPEVGNGGEAVVTFVCGEGSLQHGNRAKAILSPTNDGEDADRGALDQAASYPARC